MVTMIIILWILIQMHAPTWTFVLLGIGALIKAVQIGIKIAE